MSSAAFAFIPLLLGWFGLASLAGGLAASVGAVRRWRREKRGAIGHALATGRVVKRYVPLGSSGRPDPPSYTIDFKTADGRATSFSTDSVGFRSKDVGDTVPVLYNLTDPDDAFVQGGERVAAYVFAVAGIIFTVAGLLMTLSALDLATRA